MKKYFDPQLTMISFDVTDNTNFDTKIGTRGDSGISFNDLENDQPGNIDARSDNGAMNASINWM